MTAIEHGRINHVALVAETAAGRNLAYDMPAARDPAIWHIVQDELKRSLAREDKMTRRGECGTLVEFCQVSFAHGSDVQLAAVAAGIHSSLAEYLSTDEDAAFKALSNLITKNTAVIDSVQLTVLLRDNATKSRHNDSVPTSALLFLRNSLYFAHDENQIDRCRRIVESSLLRRMLKFVDGDDAAETSKVDKDGSLRFALCMGIMDTLFHEGFAPDLLRLAVTDSDVSTPPPPPQQQQRECRLVVLKYLDQYCFYDKVGPNSNVPTVLVDEFQMAVEALDLALAKVTNETRQSREAQGSSFLWTDVALLLSALAALLSQTSAVPLLALTSVQDAVAPAVKALGLAHQCFPRAKGGRSGKEQRQVEGLPNVKRDCITIISNLSHGHKEIQDRVRELDGLPLILGQCNIDDLNPYLREHAMYCIRNLLDNNKANQAIVDSIKPVGIEQSGELTDLGFSAQLKDGKVGVSRLPKIESINED